MQQQEIGGYFEFELEMKENFYPSAIALNNGRMCLKYILVAKNYTKIYVPYYICDSIIEVLEQMGISFEYYRIDRSFFPQMASGLKDNECLLYVNYFGLNDDMVYLVVKKFGNVIVDNTQAFFQSPLPEVDTFYSARKFFGVTDGGFLFTNKIIETPLAQDVSFERYHYTIGRIDETAQKHYPGYTINEKNMSSMELLTMSKLTKRILSSINYAKVRDVRNTNFETLHQKLKRFNQFQIDTNNLNGPMAYPLLTYNLDIKKVLIKNKIYVATYWREVLEHVEDNWFESDLVKFLIPLPIDQRYGEIEMKKIINIVESVLGKDD